MTDIRKRATQRQVFAWLQLSDLHSGLARTAGEVVSLDEILGALVEDIAFVAQRTLSVPPRLILFLGDLAQTGGARSRNEYAPVTKLLREIQPLMHADCEIGLVPGNHDVRRSQPTSGRSLARLINGLRHESDPVAESLETAMANAGDRKALLTRRSSYAAFVAGVATSGFPVIDGSAEGSWTHRANVRGAVSLEFAAFDTSLLCDGDDDEGLLQLWSQAQLVGISPDRQAIAVALMHHPPEWLRKADEIDARLRRRFDVLCHGHLHFARGGESRRLGTPRSLLRVESGALFDPSPRSSGALPALPRDHTYCFVSVVQTDDGTAIRVFPRKWDWLHREFRQDVALCDRDQIYADTVVRRRRSALPRRPLSSLAERKLQVKQFGGLRTAFPTDLSLSELAERSLIVETLTATMAGESTTTDAIAARVRRGESLLILGEPGAGKSVMAYDVIHRLVGNGTPPFVLRGAHAIDALQSKTRNRGLATLLRDDTSKAPLIVDALDEASLSSVAHATRLFELLGANSLSRGCLVTCRRRDFDEFVADQIQDVAFDAILTVQPWRLDHEFRAFVSTFDSAGLLSSGHALLSAVEASPQLQILAVRPLFARMLSYLDMSAWNSIAGRASLYSEYMRRLADSASTSHQRARVLAGTDVLTVWSEVAWQIFRSGANTAASIDLAAQTRRVRALRGLTRAATARVLQPIFDVSDARQRFVGEAIHYSFVEYLVALYLFSQLVEKHTRGKTLIALLEHDLPPEIRHFLSEMLNSSQPRLDAQVLSRGYTTARQQSLTAEVRTCCNLLAYLISRVAVAPDLALVQLLETEDDPFLRQALLWAACHVGMPQGLKDFWRLLKRSPDERALNRGYLRHYYGDLTQTAPPFIDHPRESWQKCREAVLRLMAEERYATDVHPLRQCLDLFTHLDYHVSRSTAAEAPEAAILAKTFERLWYADVPTEVMLDLLGMAAIVGVDLQKTTRTRALPKEDAT